MTYGVLSFYVSKSHPDYKVAFSHLFESRRLYNTLNKVRVEFDEKRKDPTKQTPVANSFAITKDMSTEARRKIIHDALGIKLPQKLSQQTSRINDEAWNSVIKARTRGEKASAPHFKPVLCEVRYTKQAFSHKRGMNKILPSNWKVGFNLPDDVNISDIQSLTLIPRPDGAELKALYHKAEVKHRENLRNNAAIDFGVTNIMTLVVDNDTRAKVVRGGKLKSLNQWTNKENARLSALICDAEGGEKTKLIQEKKRLWRYRDKVLYHYLSSASNEVVQYLLDNDVQNVVIGWNESFKHKSRMSRRNNQNFVGLPHAYLRDMLTRKCEEVGISVLIQEESYTSKASFLDGDDIPVYSKENKKHAFSGRRIKRGLYKTSTGMIIHADVNASWNILKKSKLPIGQSSWVSSFPENLRVKVARNQYL